PGYLRGTVLQNIGDIERETALGIAARLVDGERQRAGLGPGSGLVKTVPAGGLEQVIQRARGGDGVSAVINYRLTDAAAALQRLRLHDLELVVLVGCED